LQIKGKIIKVLKTLTSLGGLEPPTFWLQPNALTDAMHNDILIKTISLQTVSNNNVLSIMQMI
jgi:hypothetical protein